MTLNTRFYVLDEIDPVELFRFGQEVLARFDDKSRTPAQQDWKETEDASGRVNRYNQLGQGLPGIWDVYYRKSEAYRTAEQAAEHDEDCEPDCDGTGWAHGVACWIECSIDTAYGGTSKGLACSELHAAMLVMFHDWLTARGARMKWTNEYTGETFNGIEGLDTLTSSGFDAMAWFHTQVVPTLGLPMPTERNV